MSEDRRIVKSVLAITLKSTTTQIKSTILIKQESATKKLGKSINNMLLNI